MQVLRCAVDGSGLTTLVRAGRGEQAARDARNHCVGVAIDLDLRRDDGTATLTWTDRGAEPEGNTLNRTRVAPEVEAPRILVELGPGLTGITLAE